MTVEDLRPVTKAKPTPEQDRDLKFAWRICKYVKSNAIVYVKDEQVIGVGAGQMARVDSARIGVDKARRFGFDPKGAAMASDAFFPFRDSVDAAAEVGVSGDHRAGGSVRDEIPSGPRLTRDGDGLHGREHSGIVSEDAAAVRPIMRCVEEK
jgi:phosphoribosylaminoimidazolecarboxamide formyltransferase/IMP cyclohydrolase